MYRFVLYNKVTGVLVSKHFNEAKGSSFVAGKIEASRPGFGAIEIDEAVFKKLEEGAVYHVDKQSGDLVCDHDVETDVADVAHDALGDPEVEDAEDDDTEDDGQ
jgi:hypothetical protein